MGSRREGSTAEVSRATSTSLSLLVFALSPLLELAASLQTFLWASQSARWQAREQ